MKFSTSIQYTSRESKAAYVYSKYCDILKGKHILDIGGDKGYLRQHLPSSSSYFTLGYGDTIDRTLNLEDQPYPFDDSSFDTVLCLDVLEHLEKIHGAFDECCRIAKEFVILSLPNPYAAFMSYLHCGKHMGRQKDMKFYGLRPEPEDDRHRWFYSPTDAMAFVEHRAQINRLSVIHFDAEGWTFPRPPRATDAAMKSLFREDINFFDLECGTMWGVLQH